MNLTTKVFISGLLLLLTVAGGILLSRMGRPLNSTVFNVHKLIALGFVVFNVVLFIGLLKNSGVSLFALVLMIISGILVAALFATGAFLSVNKETVRLLLLIHVSATIVLFITASVSAYLIMSKR